MASGRNRGRGKQKKQGLVPSPALPQLRRDPFEIDAGPSREVVAEVSIATDLELDLLDEAIFADEEEHGLEPLVPLRAGAAREDAAGVAMVECAAGPELEAKDAAGVAEVERAAAPAPVTEDAAGVAEEERAAAPAPVTEDAAGVAEEERAAAPAPATVDAAGVAEVELTTGPEPVAEDAPGGATADAGAGAAPTAQPASGVAAADGVAEQGAGEPGQAEAQPTAAEAEMVDASGDSSVTSLQVEQGRGGSATAGPGADEGRPAPGVTGPRVQAPELRPPALLLEVAEADDVVRASALHHLINLRIAHARGDMEGVRASFLAGIEEFPREGGLYAYLGLALMGWGALAEARALLAEGIERDPDSRFLYEVLAELELKLSHRESARRLLTAALDRFPPEVGMLRRSARQAVRIGDLRWAQQLAEAALEASDEASVELQTLAREIRRRREALQNAARAELKRVVARDIRAPLEVISAYVSLLSVEPDPERRAYFAGRIDQQLESLRAFSYAAQGEALDEP
jgi:hypothetical protein